MSNGSVIDYHFVCRVRAGLKTTTTCGNQHGTVIALVPTCRVGFLSANPCERDARNLHFYYGLKTSTFPAGHCRCHGPSRDPGTLAHTHHATTRVASPPTASLRTYFGNLIPSVCKSKSGVKFPETLSALSMWDVVHQYTFV